MDSTNTPSLNALVTQIQATTEQLSSKTALPNETERQDLLSACARLTAAAETPVESVSKLVFAIHPATAVRVAMEMGVFDLATKAQRPYVTVEELSANANAEQLLVVRIVRVLVALEIFEEVHEGAYRAAPIAKAYVTGCPLGDALIHFHDVHAQVLARLPEYFTKKGFANPDDASSGPFQYAFETELHYFDWLKTSPKQSKAFNSLMTAQRQGRGAEWFEFFPVEERFGRSRDTDPSSLTLLVDIGGGLGNDLMAFKARYPSLPGRLVLQDLPETIEGVKELDSGIDAMVHNFFTPQRVEGARAYYLRTILHDWPDRDARAILKNILPAMSRDSILLINEQILPSSGVPLFPAQLDLSMMGMFSSMERTRGQWEALLNSAGFDVAKVWTPHTLESASASLIEAVPRRSY